MSERRKQTKAVAFGGVISALSIVVMLLTGLFPTAEYALPAIAGVLLVAVVIEYGCKQAMICYIAVAVISLLLVPNKEPAVLFTAFFGYYPILKSRLEQLRFRWVEWLLKMVLLNGGVIFSYLALITLFGMKQVLSEISAFGGWGVAAFLLAANLVFVVFDLALGRVIALYITRIRPRFSDKFH